MASKVTLWVNQRHALWRWLLLLVPACLIFFSMLFLLDIPLFAHYGKNIKQAHTLQKKLAGLSRRSVGRAIYADELLTPEQMLVTLEVALNSSSGVKLVSVDKVQVEKVGSLYKHELNIRLQTTYFDFLNYLNSLRALNMPIYYDGMQYQDKKYPNAVADLKIFSLSRQPAWIKVK